MEPNFKQNLLDSPLPCYISLTTHTKALYFNYFFFIFYQIRNDKSTNKYSYEVIRFDLVTNAPFGTLPLSNHPNGVNVYVLQNTELGEKDRFINL